MSNPTKKVVVISYPFVTQYGEIEVPADLNGLALRKHIEEHFNDIRFSEPNLDYKGADLDVEDAHE